MIGPVFRSPRRGPRSEPQPAGVQRRARNILVDALELLLIPFARWERRTLDITTVRIGIAGLPTAFDGYRIVFLTDLHASPLVPRWWLDRAVATANALEGDVILLGGDFVDDDPHYVADLAPILTPLRAPDGVFAVLGNHDHYVDAGAVRAALHAAGVVELFNRNVVVGRGGEKLALCGVGELEMDVIDFERTVGRLPAEVPRIVMSHDPDVFAYWPAHLRCDLMLSGHTHGGQAFLPIIGPPFVPSQFGARYLAGRFVEGPRQLYVSRGIGVSGAPFRWKCPPELTVIQLTRAP